MNSGTIPHWIAGQHNAGSSGRTEPLHNPATGEVIAAVPMANQADVEAAVAAAREALPAWSATPPLKRARVMFRFKALIEEHRDELIGLINRDHGKVLSDAAGSLQRGLEVVEFACGIPQLLKGEFSADVAGDVDSWSRRMPVGVCVGITPFNFPAMVPMWMFPLAIACGNTFVLKPSEKTPTCALRLAELLHEAGLPPGVLNVLQGDREAVDALLANDHVAAVSFVGSTPVARAIYERCGQTGKRVQALGGAKNHLVVMPDADIDQAADALIGAAYGSAGERCMAISVAVAVGDAGDALRAALDERIPSLTVGPGDREGIQMGPLITREHRDRVAGYVQTGADEGAELAVDGRDWPVTDAGEGYFLGPTLLDRVTPDMQVYREEIFGPVLCLVRAETLAEAIAIMNGHEFANGAAIFTRSGKAARDFTQQADAGMLGVNVAIPVPMAFHSFGGTKASLYGDSNVHGAEGVRFYTQLKTVTARWPDGLPGDGPSLDMPVM